MTLESVCFLVENRVIEILQVGLLVFIVFISVERFLTLVVFAERIVNSPLVIAIGKSGSEPREIAKIAQNGSCLLSMLLRNIAIMSSSDIRDFLESELYRLNRPVYMLRLIAGVAPLTGLLGTVLGMMLALNSPNAEAGVSSALTATAAGLVVAVTALIAAYFSEQRVGRLIARIEEIIRKVKWSI